MPEEELPRVPSHLEKSIARAALFIGVPPPEEDELGDEDLDVIEETAEETPEKQPTVAPAEEPAPKKKRVKHKLTSEEDKRERMKKFFQDNAMVLAQSIVDVASDEEAKPTERLAAARIALEFGFGKANTQEAPAASGRPEIKMDGLPSVEEMKRRANGRKTA